ncbi:MAG: hypothetical protein ACTSPF_14555 [Candidatus Heimdallarchaeaceae archaeon]
MMELVLLFLLVQILILNVLKKIVEQEIVMEIKLVDGLLLEKEIVVFAKLVLMQLLLIVFL